MLWRAYFEFCLFFLVIFFLQKCHSLAEFIRSLLSMQKDGKKSNLLTVMWIFNRQQLCASLTLIRTRIVFFFLQNLLFYSARFGIGIHRYKWIYNRKRYNIVQKKRIKNLTCHRCGIHAHRMASFSMRWCAAGTCLLSVLCVPNICHCSWMLRLTIYAH